ncbi:hypothetical protein [Oscillibacter sp.]|uniref:hypothetical protein n=1 Tax=Oscillibacter sp. TaxID=1945593 RepID=UPI002898EBC2|nr:hypothetical protein [Oscillibacter sp.]
MMIFDERGVQILKRDGTYYLGIEDGGHMSRYWEFEITKEDAESVMRDASYSTKLLLDYQNKLWGLVK